MITKGGGHSGRDETTRKIQREYLWPKARPWVEQYVKGCAVCQQNKNLTHRPCVPLFKIHVPLRKGAGKRTRHCLEPLHSVSPPNGWAYRAEEPMGRAIPALGHDQSR